WASAALKDLSSVRRSLKYKAQKSSSCWKRVSTGQMVRNSGSSTVERSSEVIRVLPSLAAPISKGTHQEFTVWLEIMTRMWVHLSKASRIARVMVGALVTEVSSTAR